MNLSNMSIANPCFAFVKVNVLDEDTLVMNLEFSVQETTCLRDSGDTSSCTFQRGYYVVSDPGSNTRKTLTNSMTGVDQGSPKELDHYLSGTQPHTGSPQPFLPWTVCSVPKGWLLSLESAVFGVIGQLFNPYCPSVLFSKVQMKYPVGIISVSPGGDSSIRQSGCKEA